MPRLSFFFSSRRRHTRWPRDWSSDVCSSDLRRQRRDNRRPARHRAPLGTRHAHGPRARRPLMPGAGTTTGSRPAPVRIEDLADPRFSPEVEEMRTAMAAMASELTLEPDALMAAASSETGLDDFGNEDFIERLDLLCRCVLTESGYGPHGIVSAYAQWVQLLKNRLLLEDLLKRHPEIHDVRIDRPIIICGLPRTGKTHLHNLIAADPALRSLPYWESLEPVLPDHEVPAAGEPDPRLARTEAALEFVNTAMPHFKRMHEMTVDHVHE